MKWFWGLLWTVAMCALLLLALEYSVIQVMQTKTPDALWTAGLLVIVLIVLFVVEGAEIAAVGLLDKDPEQLVAQDDKATLTELKKDPELFFTGRQLIVVSSVVGVTFLATSLAEVQPIVDKGWFLERTTSKGAIGFFAFAFPTFVVLWFAQLLPKFLAQESPVRMFGWATTKLFLHLSILLGKVHIGLPSQWMKNFLDRFMPAKPPKLMPSRLSHYEAGAALRHGRACRMHKVEILVGPGGHIDVQSHYEFEAFGPAFDKVRMGHGWGAKIFEPTCTLIDAPPECGSHTVDIQLADAIFPASQGLPAKTVTEGKVTFDLAFQQPVPIGKSFTCKAHHRADNGATEVMPGKWDEYVHTIMMPTACLLISVRPSEDNPIVFGDGRCVVHMTGDAAVDAHEAKRAKSIPRKGGYDFEIAYPHEGSRLSFSWKVGKRSG